MPTQKRAKDEMKKGTTAAAAGSIIFAIFFNVLLFIVAPLLLTNALFIAAGWAAPAPTTAEPCTGRANAKRAAAASGDDRGDCRSSATAANNAWYKRALGQRENLPSSGEADRRL